MRAADLPIARTCPIDLPDSFRDGARAQHCSHCDTTVHVLSSMTEREAEAFLREAAERDVCITYLVRPDGGIHFRPEPAIVPISALRRRAPAIAAAGLGLALAACAPHGTPPHDRSAPDPMQATPTVQAVVPDEPCETTAPDPVIRPREEAMPMMGGKRMPRPSVEPALAEVPQVMTKRGRYKMP